MSRNEGRTTGLPEEHVVEHGDPPAPAIAQQAPPTEEAPTFNWTNPTEVVSLPSGGKFYGPDHPLHGKNTIEIKYMTAKEEDILTSQALIREGVAVDRMLQNLLVDKRLDVNSLLLGDKNALIVASRVTGYGPEYNTKVTCPACSANTEHTFDLSDPDTINFEENMNSSACHLDENSLLVATLPLTKVEVRCRFLTGHDEMNQFNRNKKKSKAKRDKSVLTDLLKSIIVSINGSTNRFEIDNFIASMPARDSMFLRLMYGSVTPNIDLSQNFECQECGHEADMEVPLTVDFLWPQR